MYPPTKLNYVIVYSDRGVPMRGIDEAAGGVMSANNNSNTKKATKMFIPTSNR